MLGLVLICYQVVCCGTIWGQRELFLFWGLYMTNEVHVVWEGCGFGNW